MSLITTLQTNCQTCSYKLYSISHVLRVSIKTFTMLPHTLAQQRQVKKIAYAHHYPMLRIFIYQKPLPCRPHVFLPYKLLLFASVIFNVDFPTTKVLPAKTARHKSLRDAQTHHSCTKVRIKHTLHDDNAHFRHRSRETLCKNFEKNARAKRQNDLSTYPHLSSDFPISPRVT